VIHLPANKYMLLPSLMRNESISLDELIHIQNTKLKRLIHHAYKNVEFYQKTFKRLKIRPEDIRSVEDLKQLPIIDKKVFHQGDMGKFLDKRCRNRDHLINIKTSGTSGTTLSFYIDRKYDQYRKANYLRPYLSNGRKITDTILRFSIFEKPKKKWFQHIGLMREECMDSSEDIDKQIRCIQKLHPSIIQGYGATLSLIASKISSENIEITPPRMVFTDSELLTSLMRQKIQAGFKAPIIDVYGTFETDNIAYQCSMKKGYHIAMDSVVLEIVKDGKNVKDGQEGEIVCTVLDNFSMPFIRYNLHDMAFQLGGGGSCGRTFPLISLSGGRSDDYLLYPDGQKKSPMGLLGHFDALAESISEFQIIQKATDKFDVQIVPISSAHEEIERRVKENVLKDFPGADIRVDFKERIDREKSGKLSSVKSFAK